MGLSRNQAVGSQNPAVEPGGVLANPADPKVWRRSTKISLIFLASVSLTACGYFRHEAQQNIYSSLEDCVQDWKDPDLCKPGNTGIDSRPVDFYSGPLFRIRSGQLLIRENDKDRYVMPPTGAGITTTRSVGTVKVPITRGGFGTSAGSRGGSGQGSSIGGKGSGS